MFVHYAQLGLLSLRRNPLLTALMIMSIAFGVAASMVTYAVFRAVSGDPIPQKSAHLFAPQVDNWGPQYNRKGEPASAMTYTDAMALMHAHKAKRQTVLFQVLMSVMPTQGSGLPFKSAGYATYGDFFSMFDVPFQYGQGWNAQDDDNRAAVAVISRDLNQKLFGGANSVGREIELEEQTYRIVGVTEHWDPKPRFFDMFNGNAYTDASEVYIPFTHAIDLKMDTGGNNSCSGVGNRGVGWDGWIRGECVWISPWVELDSKADADEYLQFLHAYAQEQQRAGRFSWAPNVRLRDVNAWLEFQHAVPPESRLSLTVALGFFVICLVNTIGLLLAKFMRRAPEIGIRRALGASRADIYRQFLAEAGMVGLAGGVLGLFLTGLGMAGAGMVFEPQIARLAHLDMSLVALTLLVAIGATVLAAFYPTWRAAQVQPAWQLKSN
ncbi:ABC transporter permease [Dyella tabacisoli]|uniref:ABC transporter permease n=1 Tax=Dyella tabacisoli TaxID=2282381 RepID=A0A369USB7_9GAMM|nr:ABC transporter permease [Dyella tabacisoli]RDD82935.1 ABC transporter permease [Dyella tabacisoli]